MTRRFLEQHSSVCAAHGLRLGPFYLPTTIRQLAFYALLIVGLAVFYCWDKKIWLTVLTFALSIAYAVVILYRLGSVFLALFFRAIGRPYEHRPTPEQLADLKPEDLPVFTILVPMYKEPEVAQKIAHAVTSFDYPVDKLDVKLLLEEDDPQTRGTVDEFFDRLPKCVEVLVCPRVPKGEPRTKPRACNWGLEKARGQYLVIYDAEDQPEGDQLKKAVHTFRKLEAAGQQKVVCLQAKLNYFNARHNWLTRFFTLEYTTWFDLFLPGLHAFGTPIPLGGTSNHFRTSVLKEVGGWDPFNVTEDCDLGERLARRGYRTHILDSTTWEEANSHVGNWIRQRSRWVKGYIQTHLVHTRDSILPFFLLAAGLLLLKSLIDQDVATKLDASVVQKVGPIASWVCLGAALISGVLGLMALVERFRQTPRTGYHEGRFGLCDALTFRITVGGLSGMLLLNMPFWILSCAYLFHKPLAEGMDAFRSVPVVNWVTEYEVDNEGTPLRDAVREWKLQYTEVRDESYAGATVWNVTGHLVGGHMTIAEARDAYDAIDRWSMASQLLYPIVIGLFLANFVFILLNLVACGVRGMWDLFPQAILAPFYWVLISIGACKGAWQLGWDPFFWEKTIHGLTPAGTPPPVARAPVLPPPPVFGAEDLQATGADATPSDQPAAGPTPEPSEATQPAAAPVAVDVSGEAPATTSPAAEPAANGTPPEPGPEGGTEPSPSSDNRPTSPATTP